MNDFERLADEPSCVGRAFGIDGHALAAWVTVSMSWRGQPRWTPRVERCFVTWSTLWVGRRYRSRDNATTRVLAVLARVDERGGRQARP